MLGVPVTYEWQLSIHCFAGITPRHTVSMDTNHFVIDFINIIEIKSEKTRISIVDGLGVRCPDLFGMVVGKRLFSEIPEITGTTAGQ